MTQGEGRDANVDQAERITRAAARAAARDRRVMWLYLGLSLVPIALAVVFLRYGRTDRELIRAEVEPIKAQVEEVKPSLEKLKDIEEVASEVQKTVTTIRTQVQEFETLKEKTATLAASTEERAQQVAALRAQADELRSALTAVEKEQKAVVRRLDVTQSEIRSEIKDLRIQVERRPVVKEPSVDDLLGRLRKLEARVAPLEKKLVP